MFTKLFHSLVDAGVSRVYLPAFIYQKLPLIYLLLLVSALFIPAVILKFIVLVYLVINIVYIIYARYTC